MESLAIFLATGAVAGLMAGLFGVGGGMIMVPALALLLPKSGVDTGIVMQVAIATSLAVIAATSISSAHAHHRRDGVLWPVLRALAPGLVAGSVLGAFVADQLPSRVLAAIVGVGALLTAAQMFADRKPKTQHGLPGTAGLAGAGGVIGLLSALIGIGGGSLTVPYLSWCGAEIRKCVGTAAAAGVPIAWAGTAGFVIAGWDVAVAGPHLGYVSLTGFAGLVVSSVACAPLGARLAHGLPPRVLKRAFAVLLTGIGLHMLLG
ncbi:MAG: sulfite exporter TauE/SafE family protein [Pseudomonadota bacterium]